MTLKNFFIIQAIEFNDKLEGKNRLQDGKPSKRGKKVKLARRVLVAEGVITEAESKELHQLINYRNTIGHQIENLTAAIGPYAHLATKRNSLDPIDAYDHDAVNRATVLEKKIFNGMRSKFILPMSFRPLMFKTAEKTYLMEIKRLKITVNKGILQYNELISEANKSISAIPKSILDSAQPGHPRHQKKNGNLTHFGKSCIYQLYEAKATPLAVAHMMRISLRTANLWFKRWDASNAELDN